MRRFAKWLGRFVLGVVVLLAVIWVIGPREPLDRKIDFDPARLSGDLDAYLAGAEAAYPKITPGVGKRIRWAAQPDTMTPISVIYLHGYSATSRELSPVPEQIADRLGANLYFARLKGHGLPGAALGEVRAGDWLEDAAEALAIGELIGERVIVIGTSTGGALATLAAAHPELADKIDCIVLVSPNYALANPASFLLALPMARQFLPLLVGETRSWQPHSEEHGRYWTTSYPNAALPAMKALVDAARETEHSQITVPVLAIFSDGDEVVRADATREVLAHWGGEVKIAQPTLTEADDPMEHVIGGEIMSPGQTEFLVETITEWVRAHEL